MAKSIDKNGFWLIKKNPISKVGVFPYMGRSISSDCDPDKVYYVYRPAETLRASVPTWDNPPKVFIDDHEMLGDGFTKVDDRPVQGIIYNPVFEDDVLYADIAVYSEELKDKISGGKKELSLGYFCQYRPEVGIYKGQRYDFIQTNMEGNHIALVDAGRCGSDVKVFDSKCTMDSLDIKSEFEAKESDNLKKNQEIDNIETTEAKDENMKYISVDEVKALLKTAMSWGDGVVDPKEKLVAELIDEKAVDGFVKTETTDEAEKEEKAEDEEEKKSEDEEEKSEDKCGKDEEESKEEKAEDSDEIADIKAMIAEIKAMLAPKATDADEDKDDDKEKAEDEEESESVKDEEEKKAEDANDVVAVFAKDNADVDPREDVALKNYLK